MHSACNLLLSISPTLFWGLTHSLSGSLTSLCSCLALLEQSNVPMVRELHPLSPSSPTYDTLQISRGAATATSRMRPFIYSTFLSTFFYNNLLTFYSDAHSFRFFSNHSCIRDQHFEKVFFYYFFSQNKLIDWIKKLTRFIPHKWLKLQIQNFVFIEFRKQKTNFSLSMEIFYLKNQNFI